VQADPNDKIRTDEHLKLTDIVDIRGLWSLKDSCERTFSSWKARVTTTRPSRRASSYRTRLTPTNPQHADLLSKLGMDTSNLGDLLGGLGPGLASRSSTVIEVRRGAMPGLLSRWCRWCHPA